MTRYSYTLLFVILTHRAGAKKCASSRAKSNNSVLFNDLYAGEYICPGENDPLAYTECCLENLCCLPSGVFGQIDEWLLRAVSITVITTCLLLTAIMVICCFWSKCLLYNTCRVNYSPSDVVHYTLADADDPLCLMPREHVKGGRFSPCKVKIRQMNDV